MGVTNNKWLTRKSRFSDLDNLVYLLNKNRYVSTSGEESSHVGVELVSISKQ